MHAARIAGAARSGATRASSPVKAAARDAFCLRAVRATADGAPTQTHAWPPWVGKTPASPASSTTSSMPRHGSPAKYAYNNAPPMVSWMVADYVDMSDEQKDFVRDRRNPWRIRRWSKRSSALAARWA